jgi:hypothetical protein
MVEDIVFRYVRNPRKKIYIGDTLFLILGAPYQTANNEEKAIKGQLICNGQFVY